ncbi:MAG: hypothetical protein DHS20C15_34580 [Planctomycetota bacterium]|nr:MAG: hypothetical protein DHS20C15_34580 [Planctomycetota bacterium]
MAASKAKPAAPKSFVEARTRLDAILEELEQEAGDVDRLASRIREASELLRFCRERLSSARQEVQQVVAELDADDAAPEASEPEQPAPPASEGDAPPDGLPF